MQTLTGKLQNFNLSTDPTKGRRYLNTNINFGMLRRFFYIDQYDPETNKGEQRLAKDRHINKLKAAIASNSYTPEAFNVTVPEASLVNVDDDNNVTVVLDEKSLLPILNGGSRFRALESLYQEGSKTARMVDDLPIPLIVQLDNQYRKHDFLSLNAGMQVPKSLLQCLHIANGRVSEDKAETFRRASELIKLLNREKDSPLKGKVAFGVTSETGKLQFSQLCTDHRATLVASFFGTAKLLTAAEQSNEWFVSLLTDLYELITAKTTYADKGNLLALPPDGAKGCVANVISVANIFSHYLYLRREMTGADESIDDNTNNLLKALRVYSEPVNGDVSRKRRQLLSCGFAQNLFENMVEDDRAPIGFHFGIPISLMVHVSNSSFGVEAPPNLAPARGKKSDVADRVESVETSKIDSDTDPLWSE